MILSDNQIDYCAEHCKPEGCPKRLFCPNIRSNVLTDGIGRDFAGAEDNYIDEEIPSEKPNVKVHSVVG